MIKKVRRFFSFQCVLAMRTFNELLWFAKELNKRQCVFKVKKKRNLSMEKMVCSERTCELLMKILKRASKRSDSVTLLEHLVNGR